MKHRGGWSEQERQLRSRLTKLVSQVGLLRGNLIQTNRTCGKAGCRCQKGHRHQSWYLGFSDQGKKKMNCVPKEWEPRIRRWVENYQEVRRLLDALSQLYLQRLRDRKD